MVEIISNPAYVLSVLYLNIILSESQRPHRQTSVDKPLPSLAKSLDKNDLLLPAILVGTLGNGIGIGTCLGFLIAGILKT